MSSEYLVLSCAWGYSTAAFQDAVFRRHWHTREMPGLWGSLWLGSEAPILLGPLCCWGLVVYLIRAFAKSLQSCPSLYDPMDHSLPGSSVHKIHQARILEWAAMPSSRGSSWLRDRTHISHVFCIGRWALYHWVTNLFTNYFKYSLYIKYSVYFKYTENNTTDTPIYPHVVHQL